MNSLICLLVLALSLAAPSLGASIVLSSSDGNATVKATVLLVCVAGGDTPAAPEVTWLFRGRNITNGSLTSDSAMYTYYNTPINISSGLHFMESILEICNIGFAEDGQYVCVTSNGTVTSNSTITVEVLEISIDVQITGREMLNEFETLILNCTASPSANISWKVNGSIILSNGADSRISLDKTPNAGAVNYSVGSLMIDNLVPSDSGEYSCVAENDGVLRPITKNHSVSVEAAYSDIVLSTVSGNVSVFSTVILVCVGGGTVVDPKITWQFNGEIVNNGTNKRKIYDSPPTTNYTGLTFVESFLEICNFQFDDEGTYTCITGHRDVVSSRSITVSGIEIPIDVSITGTATLDEFETLTLTCIASPPATMTWRFSKEDIGGRVLSPEHYTNSNPDDAPQNTSTSTVMIREATQAHSGFYTCVANNGATRLPATEVFNVTINVIDACELNGNPCKNNGTCYDHEYDRGYTCICTDNYEGETCQNKVQEEEPQPPEVIVSPKPTKANLTMPINLTCTAEGHPTPTYEWYKDGKLIPDEIFPFLYIPEPLPEDRGDYTCVAINSHGNGTSQEAELDIDGLVQYSASVNISVERTQLQERIIEGINDIELNVSSVFSVQVLNSSDSHVLQLLITFENVPTVGERSTILNLIERRLNSAIRSFSMVLSVQLTRYDGCNPETYNGVMWPETRPGSTASVECPCAERLGSLAGERTRVCRGTFSLGAFWEESVDDSQCATTMSERTRQLCAIPENIANATIEEQVNVSRIVEEITSAPEELTAPDVSASVSTLVQLTEGATESEELGMVYLAIVDNIQKVEPEVALTSQKETDSSSKVLQSLESFQDKVNISVNSTGSEGTATFAFRTFAIQIQEIDPTTYQGQTFSVNLGPVEDTLNTTGDIPQESLNIKDSLGRVSPNNTATVQLPRELFNDLSLCKQANASSSSQARFSYGVFLSDVLFQNETQSHLELGSIIVAPRIRCEANITLKTPIKVSFRTNRMVKENSSMRLCASWDSDVSRSWSLENCEEVTSTTVKETLKGSTDMEKDKPAAQTESPTFEFKRFAHFGLLFDTRELDHDVPPGPESLVLYVISCVGLGISLLCLIIFVISHLTSKKLRTAIHSQLLINMSFALMGVYIVFLIGSFITDITVLCIISSSLMQYFLLVFFGWTTVEVFWLYIKLVKVFGIQSLTSKYTLKAGIPTWLIPLLIVVAGAGPGSRYYNNEVFCRPSEWPFYFGMILPFCVLYLINWIMFFIIMASICKHTREFKTQDKSKYEQAKKNFTIAVTLAVIFGLGWGIGLASTHHIPVRGISLAFQILFSILVCSQGILIFVFHGIRNQDVRNLWKQGFTRLGGQSLVDNVMLLTKSSSAGSSQSSQQLHASSNLYTTSSGEMSLPRKKKILGESEHVSESVPGEITKAEIAL